MNTDNTLWLRLHPTGVFRCALPMSRFAGLCQLIYLQTQLPAANAPSQSMMSFRSRAPASNTPPQSKTSLQTKAPAPKAPTQSKIVDYPWLYGPTGQNQPWKDRNDQFLIDAMVRGSTYAEISQHLSRGLIKRSEEACRKRVEFLTTWENGGHLLPKHWDWTEAEVARWRIKYSRSDTELTPKEFEEILLFRGRGMRGLKAGVFRDLRSAARLNREVQRLDSLNPRLFNLAVRVLQKRRKELLRPERGRPKRVAASVTAIKEAYNRARQG